jgi:dihydroorotase
VSGGAPVAEAVLVEGGRLFDPGAGIDVVGDLLVEGGVVVRAGTPGRAPSGALRVDARGRLVTPSFTDLHAHLREPGGEAAETIATGTAAALAGGFSTVLAMPNTRPVADSPDVIRRVLAAAAAAGPCEVVPVSSITMGLAGRQMVDFAAQAAAGAGAYSDDGSWVADDALADRAFAEAARRGALLMEHCEDFSITGPGVLHDAEATRRAGVAGIPREAEDRATRRDVELARRHGARLHLCHVSTAGAVEALRAARAAGARVTAEATPHHLVLTVDDAVRGGPDFKMKPPLRERGDVAALVAALEDGTIDAVGTDHAPHEESKKAEGIARAPFGAVGLETAFPVLYTRLVERGALSLRRLVEALVTGPARVLGRAPASLAPGSPARAVVIDVVEERVVDRAAFRTKGRNCPFHGMRLRGWPVTTVVGRFAVSHGR